MRVLNKIVALLLLPMFVITSPAFAQVRVVDAAALEGALAQKADAERAQREVVQRVLERDDVRALAERMGLDLQDASAAVATLTGADLAQAAQHAGAVESAALAGGATTVVISLTTLLLVLLIVILLAR